MSELTNSGSSMTHGAADAYFGAKSASPADEPLSDELRATIDEWVATHPGGGERLIPLLHLAQETLGYLPSAVQEYVARQLDLSPIQVFGVVSFYHFFTTTPRGRFQLKVCTGTACFVQGAADLVGELEKVLGIQVGGVTEDLLFSLEQVRCIGACGLAPAMMIGNEVHGNLDIKGVRRLVRKLKTQAQREADGSGEAQSV